MELPYAAGLLDADGWVRINFLKSKGIYQLKVGVVNLHEPTLQHLKDKFGGSIHTQWQPTSSNARPTKAWDTSSSNAGEFLRQIRPYLTYKRDQADLALEFQTNIEKYRGKLGTRWGYSDQRDAVMKFRKQCREKLSELKARTYPDDLRDLPPNVSANASLDYLAGLFDADGSVMCVKKRRTPKHTTYQLRCQFTNVYGPMVKLFEHRFGGRVFLNKSDRYNEAARRTHVWICVSRVAASFLREISPSLSIKREQAELALMLQDSIDRYRGKLKHSPDGEKIWAEREQIYQKIGKLK
jgi:hypothetical protein